MVNFILDGVIVFYIPILLKIEYKSLTFSSNIHFTFGDRPIHW